MTASPQRTGSLRTVSTAAGARHFVVFRVERRRYALPLDTVKRALRNVALTPAPDSPPWITGLIHIAGEVFSVLDLRVRFGLPGHEPRINDRLLLVENKGQTLVLLVDEVLDVVTCMPGEVKAPPAELASTRPLAAMLQLDGRLVLVLDADRLLPDPAPEATRQ